MTVVGVVLAVLVAWMIAVTLWERWQRRRVETNVSRTQALRLIVGGRSRRE